MKVSESTRSKRRKQTAEVFTPPELVNEILDKLDPSAWDPEKTFCDPAAGNGNFLVEVYRRKVETYHHDPLVALTTVYGVELMEDNVAELRDRMLSLALEYGVSRDDAMRVLNKNIVCHDALTYDFSFGEDGKVSTSKERPFMFGGVRL